MTDDSHKTSHTFDKRLTVIELIILLVLVIALASVFFILLHPSERLKDARNARRASDVDAISSAIHASIIENKGEFPTGLQVSMDEKQIGTAANGCSIRSNGCRALSDTCINLLKGSQNLKKYLRTLPVDPKKGSAFSSERTGYTVHVDASGVITVRACGTEENNPIFSQR